MDTILTTNLPEEPYHSAGKLSRYIPFKFR